MASAEYRIRITGKEQLVVLLKALEWRGSGTREALGALAEAIDAMVDADDGAAACVERLAGDAETLADRT